MITLKTSTSIDSASLELQAFLITESIIHLQLVKESELFISKLTEMAAELVELIGDQDDL